MTNKPKRTKDKTINSYRVIGYIFLLAAVIMFLSQNPRGVSIAFFAIGITFTLIPESSDDNPAKK